RELGERALLRLGRDAHPEAKVHELIDDPLDADDVDAAADRGESRAERLARRELRPLPAIAFGADVRDVVAGHLQLPLCREQRRDADAENSAAHVLPPRGPASGGWPAVNLLSADPRAGLSGAPGRPRSRIARILSA